MCVAEPITWLSDAYHAMWTTTRNGASTCAAYLTVCRANDVAVVFVTVAVLTAPVLTVAQPVLPDFCTTAHQPTLPLAAVFADGHLTDGPRTPNETR